MADDEDELLRIEGHLVTFLRDDPRLLRYAEGLTAECFRNPRNATTFRDVVAGADIGSRTNGPVLSGPHVRKWTQRLVAAATSRRPPVEHQVPESDHDARLDSNATAQPERKPPASRPRPQWQRRPPGRNDGHQRRQRTGFSQGRVNERRGALRAVHRHELKKRNQRSTNETFDAYVAALERAFAPRDVLDPDAVSAAALGKHLHITLASRLEIEHEENAFRIEQGWQEPGDPPFRLKTIQPCDLTSRQAERYYATARKAKQRERAELQNEEQQMTTTQTTTTRRNGVLYRQAIEAQVAHTRRQLDELHDAIGDGNRTTSELAVILRSKPAWRQVPDQKFGRTLLDRLDVLEEEGRIVTVDTAPGPRGRRLRVVKRTGSND